MQGVSGSVLGIMMGVGAAFGIIATFTYPFIVRCLGLPKTGVLGLGLQVNTLTPPPPLLARLWMIYENKNQKKFILYAIFKVYSCFNTLMNTFRALDTGLCRHFALIFINLCSLEGHPSHHHPVENNLLGNK